MSPTATTPSAQARPGPRRAASVLLHPAAKVLLFLLCAAPMAWYTWAAVADQLGANPAEALIRGLGDWTLRGLCLTLAITPLRTILKQPALLRFRRMLGVWTFAYGSLHLLAYALFDKGLDFSEIAHDIAKRPFILMGFTAWLLMLPLAATSFNKAIKAMGGKRWQALHKAIYAVAIIGLMHFIWMRAGKHNFAEPAVYGAILAVLLGWRVWARFARAR